MRTLVVLVVGATAMLGGCAETKAPLDARALPQQDWVLIAPPEDHLTAAFLDTFEFLPDHQDRFPRDTDGLSEQEVRSLKTLFEQVAAEPSPEARLRVLTESSDTAKAPVERWREVRIFKSSVACESTRAELVKVTDEQATKVGAYDGMPREEFQWPMLARSFHASRCVPGHIAARSVRAG